MLNFSVLNSKWILFFFLFCFVLHILGLTNQISSASFVYIFFVISCIFPFILLEVVFGNKVLHFSPNSWEVKPGGLILVFLTYLLSLSFLLYEFYVFYIKFGNIPIFLFDYEVKRLEFPVNGYIHLVAMLQFQLLPVMYFFNKFGNAGQKYYPFFLFFSACLAIFMGNRGVLGFLFFNLFLIFSVKSNLTALRFSLTVIAGVFFLGILKFYRDFAFYGDSIFEVVENNSSFEGGYIGAVMYYSYITLVMNFEFLSHYINADFSHLHGYFTLFSPFASVLPFDLMTEKDFQSNLLRLDFHGTLTGTGLAIPYIDYGGFTPLFLLLILFPFYILKRNLFRGNISLIPVYCYIYSNLFLIFYTYMFNKFYVLANIVMTLFFTSVFFRRSQ